MNWQSKPENAWCNHILPEAQNNPTWIEDSRPISDKLKLSKRELFSLIILAHTYSNGNGEWRVGFDIDDEEPNDGFFIKGKNKVRVEHKVVAQMQKEEVMKAILSIYKKSAKKGRDYGKDRILIIQPNKPSDHGGLVKISDLSYEIGEESPFDKVFTLMMVSSNNGGRVGIMHLIQHYPPLKNRNKPGDGITQIDFDLISGSAKIPHAGIVTE